MKFNFNYRDEFYISCEADSEEDARHNVMNGIGEMEIENLGGLWSEYLEADEEDDDEEDENNDEYLELDVE